MASDKHDSQPQTEGKTGCVAKIVAAVGICLAGMAVRVPSAASKFWRQQADQERAAAQRAREARASKAHYPLSAEELKSLKSQSTGDSERPPNARP